MTRSEYMDQLKEALKGFDTEIQEEIISDYEEHFTMGAASGKSDDEIAAELGSIDELVEELKSLSEKKTSTEKTTAKSVFDGDFDPNKAIDDAVRGFAGLLGSMAAGLTKGAEKLSSEFGNAVEKKNEAQEAERMVRSWAKDLNDVADKVVKSSSKVADRVLKGSSKVADKVVEKSSSFVKEMGESINNMTEHVKPAPESSSTEEGKVTETYSCGDEVKKVVIETDCGNVLVKKSEDDGYKFDYENNGSANQQLAYKFNWFQEGDTIKVVCKKEVGRSTFFSGLTCPDILVSVEIPADLDRLDVHTVSGDIKLDGINVNTLKINTMSGEVTTANSEANTASAGTVSGDITVVNTNIGAATFNTVSGDLTYEGITSTVKAGTTSGDLDIKARDAREIGVNTVSGDANVYLINATGYVASLKTVSGDLSLTCGDEKCKYIRNGNYTMGDGGCLINAGSVSGDIAIYA